MRKSKWLWLTAGLALLLAACGGQTSSGGSGGGGGGGPTPSFTIALNPTSLTVQQGSSGTTTLTLTPQNGFTGTVSLALVDGNVNPVSGITLSPASVDVTGSSPVTETLTVQVAASVAPDTYNLQVRATSGSLTKTANLTLTVTEAPPPPSPDFTISLNPTSLTVEQGSSGTTTLTLTPQNGFTGTVDLALVDGNGNPVPGTTLSPTSVDVTGSSPVSQPLTLSVAAGVAPGTYNLQVRATSGSLTKTANLTVTVTASLRVTMDWSPLGIATSQVGQNGPITLTGTLEGTPTAPLRLQLSYRPKGGDWGPWEDVAEFQVQGNQVTATIPAPGLDLPVGLDELGKEVRARVVMGDQVLESTRGWVIRRFYPIWATQWSHPGHEYHASQAALCGYDNTDWREYRSRVACWNPENGEPLVQADLTGFRIYDVYVSPEGKVYLAGDVRAGSRTEPAVRVYASPQALGTAALTEFRLSGTFAHVTAVAAEGDYLYVGGNHWVESRDPECSYRFLRVRLAKYRLSGPGASLVALHDPTPQDLQEIDLQRYGQCANNEALNSTSVPVVRLDGGKLYAIFVHTSITIRDDNRAYWNDSSCLGLMRLDTATFQREWLNRPLRSGANGEDSYSINCRRDLDFSDMDRSLEPWELFFYYNYYNDRLCDPLRPCNTVVYSYREFDIGDTHLYAARLYEPGTYKVKLLRKDGGQEEVTEIGAGSELLVFMGGGDQMVGRYRGSGTRASVYLVTYRGEFQNLRVEFLFPLDAHSETLLREGNKVYLVASSDNGGWVLRIR